ncbi:FUSC family protein [Paenibacillus pini]|uniref:Lipoprotein n=1 Tax=Paenibacillus pini JCM 16418 TaxID=1236976 RepID=W7YDV0_9BACL|nr:aromatic acid exporter family protein [Paenibacillus pini]GAF06652.1 lipoprotein [Paenibacillus pini JCM 16418]
MTFGARMLKTGIAVTLALYISLWLHLTAPVIAAVAAIFAMQPSIYRSWRYFLDQLQTNTLGAIIALAAGAVFSNEPIAVGLACILVIMICLKLKMGDTIGLTLVTVIAVMEASGQWQFALTRFSLSLIGIVSAFLINILLFPPKPKVQFIGQIQYIYDQMSLLLRTSISDEIRENVFRDQKRQLEDSVKALSDKYKLFEEEQKKLKRATFSQTRHLVVYKQMLNTLRKGIEVLDAIEEHYFQSERADDTDEYFDLQLEHLTKFHEHVLLKFDDKLKPNCTEPNELEEANNIFMKEVIKRVYEHPEGKLRISIVAATMYDYGYQLERLNRLVDHYHKSDDEEPSLWMNWMKK